MVKLVLLDYDGSRVEVRCDRCRHWEHYTAKPPPHARWKEREVYYCAKFGGCCGEPEETEPDFGCAMFEVKPVT